MIRRFLALAAAIRPRRGRIRRLEDRVAALESCARWQEAALHHHGMVLGDQAVRLSRAAVRIDELEARLLLVGAFLHGVADQTYRNTLAIAGEPGPSASPRASSPDGLAIPDPNPLGPH